jgi:hypothetical protein
MCFKVVLACTSSFGEIVPACVVCVCVRGAVSISRLTAVGLLSHHRAVANSPSNCSTGKLVLFSSSYAVLLVLSIIDPESGGQEMLLFSPF